MTERPILMSAPMVLAILEDRKTNTRRVMRAQPPEWIDRFGVSAFTPSGHVSGRGTHPEHGPAEKFYRCPYGVPGDRLWVKETWAAGKCSEGLSPSMLSPSFYDGPRSDNGGLWYRADSAEPAHPVTTRGRWRTSLHMPRWASRLTLEIVSVRAERLQDISEEDAKAEGVTPDADCLANRCMRPYRDRFLDVWDEINGKRKGCGWRDNPWVWRIEFRRQVSP